MKNKAYMLKVIKENLSVTATKLQRKQMENEYIETMMMGMKQLGDAALKRQYEIIFKANKNEVSH